MANRRHSRHYRREGHAMTAATASLDSNRPREACRPRGAEKRNALSRRLKRTQGLSPGGGCQQGIRRDYYLQ
jgi:hypothetical protein